MQSVDVKRDYAFIEYEDDKQANEAVSKMDGQEVDGHKLMVQIASSGKGKSHGPNNEDVCYNCGMRGHW